MMAIDQIDVHAILPQLRRPTLALQRRGDLQRARSVRCGATMVRELEAPSASISAPGRYSAL